MINNKKHIIFDWNGPLIDDAWIFVDVLNQLLIPRGLNKISLQEYRDAFCFPIKLFYKKLGVDISEQSFMKLEEEFVHEYNKRMYKPALFDNVLNFLKQLIENGVSLSILSASNEGVLCKLVKHYALENYFDYVVGVNNYGANGKVESGENLLHKINLKKSEIIMIGDTDYDYDVATSLQLDCILKTGGHQSLNRLQIKTKNTISSFDEIAINNYFKYRL